MKPALPEITAVWPARRSPASRNAAICPSSPEEPASISALSSMASSPHRLTHPGHRERLRQRAKTHGAAYLHRILTRLDRAAAAAIHANDVPKVVRAIEVSLAAQTTADPAMAERPRRPHRLSHPASRPRTAAPAALRAHQPACRRHVRPRPRRRDRTPHRTLWPRLPSAHVARLRRGRSGSSRRDHPRTSRRSGPARPSQLRQTAGHMVPPRA